MPVGRVCIFPCGGIKKVGSCVTRLAGYLVDEALLPGKVLILCVPAFLRGVEEDISMVEKSPTIIIEGCEELCGSNLFRIVGIKPAAMIHAPEITQETGIGPGDSRQTLDESGKKLSRIIAEKVACISTGMLNAPEYHYERQNVMRGGKLLSEYTIDMMKSCNYIRVKPGIYRPSDMPPLPIEKEVAS
jgi:uncharacterized metal-binding protein